MKVGKLTIDIHHRVTEGTESYFFSFVPIKRFGTNENHQPFGRSVLMHEHVVYTRSPPPMGDKEDLLRVLLASVVNQPQVKYVTVIVTKST